jgi:hypothetical protein
MKIVIDLPVLVSAFQDRDFYPRDLVAFIQVPRHNLCVDYDGVIEDEYEKNLGRNKEYQKWRKEIKDNKVLDCNHPCNRPGFHAHRTYLAGIGCHTSDIALIEVADDAGALLVLSDEIANTDTPERVLLAQVLGYLTGQIGIQAKSVIQALDMLKKEHPKEVQMSQQKSPWRSGSFYLVTAVVIIACLTIVAQFVSLPLLFIVLIGSIITVGIVGALQLRQDEKLNEKNFLSLMIETYMRLPLLRGIKNENFPPPKK